MIHTLKTHPAMFRAIRDGRKNFEVRKDDRAFQAGDILRLEYHDPDAVTPWGAPPMPIPKFDPADDTATAVWREVTFVLRGGQYGIHDGYVAMALAPHTPDFGDKQ